MLLLKRAKNGLSHFLLLVHTSSVSVSELTLWYLFKIGFPHLSFMMGSIRGHTSPKNMLYLEFFSLPLCSLPARGFFPG